MNRGQKVAFGLVVAALVLAAVPAIVQLAWHARLFAGRATFPLDLEWMEGGTLIHAQRIASGQGIYVAPTVDFIPYLYTPLYPALLALLSYVLPLGYLLGRVVSILAFAGALAFIVASAAVASPSRWRRLALAAVGLCGAGAVAASFVFTGNFYDLVRADSLVLVIQAAAFWLAWRGTTWKSAALAGVLIALAFFTKQTATIVGIGIGAGLLLASPKRGGVYGLTAAAVLAAGVGFLTKLSHGWFWTYIFKLHQSHAFRKDAIVDVAWPFTQQFAWPIFVVLIAATVALAFSRGLRRRDLLLWSVALAGEAAALVGFGTQWADSNAYIPAIFFPSLAAAALSARLVDRAMGGPRWLLPLAAACALLLGAQSLHTRQPQSHRHALILTGWPKLSAALPAKDAVVPSATDRAAAARLLQTLRELPEPLFIPFHPYYAVLAGKRPYVHRMGVRDVEAALGRPKGLAEALANRTFAAIVLDWKSYPGEWPYLSGYKVAREFVEGVDSVRTFAGAQTSPRTLLVPR